MSPWDTGADHIVEVGVDNFVVEGDRSQCDATGVLLPPSGIEDSLRATKGPDGAVLSWASSPIDGTHDGAAYYRIYSSTTAEVGFS